MRVGRRNETVGRGGHQGRLSGQWRDEVHVAARHRLRRACTRVPLPVHLDKHLAVPVQPGQHIAVIEAPAGR
jgi:hypothetical protein